MPKLVRLYIVHCAIGFAVAAVFVGGLIALDVANLRGLVFGSEMGWLAAAMLVISNGVVFAGVQFAIAVMRLAEPEGGPGGGTRRPIRVEMTPIPVKATAVPRRRQ